MRRAAIIALIVGAAATGTASAQLSPKAQAEKAKADKANAKNPDGSDASAKQRVLYQVKDTNGIFKFDYGPPTSPAMSLLGLSGDTTPPSTSLTEIVVALPGLYGGDAGQSLAFDVPAARLFQKRSRSSYDSYLKGSAFYRIGYRTRIGFAALNGNDGGGDASKQIASRLAFGLSTSLLNSADPLLVRNEMGLRLLDACLEPLAVIAQPILDAGVDKVAVDTNEVGQKLNRARTLLRVYGSDNGKLKDTYTTAQRDAARVLLGLSPPPPAVEERPNRIQRERKPDPALEKIGRLLASAKSKPNADPDLIQALELMLEEMSAERDAGRPPPEPAPAPPVLVAAGPEPTDENLFERLKRLETKLAAELDQGHARGGASIDEQLTAAGVTAGVTRCNESATRIARFSRDLDVGFGMLAQGAPGKLKDLHANGQVAWLAFKTPIGKPHFSQGLTQDDPLSPLPDRAILLAAAGRFGFDERLATENKTTPEFRADTINAWVGIEWLTPSYRLTGQYGWLEVDARDPIGKPFEKSGERYLVGAQIRLKKDSPLWLGLQYGNGYGTVGELKANTALVTLSYSAPAPPDISAP